MIKSLILVKNLSDAASGAVVSGYNTNLPKIGATHSQLTTIINIVISIAAAIAVLFIVIGGLRYVVSSGDPQKTSRAKDTIIYAVVGLLVCIIAEAIVAFALNSINSNT